jgi:lysophospholipase L1-like esterase
MRPIRCLLLLALPACQSGESPLPSRAAIDGGASDLAQLAAADLATTAAPADLATTSPRDLAGTPHDLATTQSAGDLGAGKIALGDGKLQILPLGDSITLGVNGGYRNRVFSSLTAAGYVVDLVGSQSDPYAEVADHDHEGHPGFTIGNIASDLAGWAGMITAPDVVLLMIGTNDIAWWYNETPSTTADHGLALINQILAQFPNTVVLVASIAPMSAKTVDPNATERSTAATQYNAELKSRATSHAEAGKRVFFVDVNAALTVSDLYDGIHPTRAAHDKVADAWLSVLRPLLP